MGTDTSTTSTPKRLSGEQRAATLAPDDWHQVVTEYEDARYLMIAFAARTDLRPGQRTCIDPRAEQAQIGLRHDRRQFVEALREQGREPATSDWDRPCCDHMATAAAEVDRLRADLADTRAALALADAALEEFRRPRGRRRMTVAA
jgi:hypothetical protein